MKNEKTLKIISGLGIGAGVGLCFGVAMDNILLGFLMGIGVGFCFAAAFTSNAGKEDNKDKKDEDSSDN